MFGFDVDIGVAFEMPEWFANIQIQAWFQQRVDRTILGRVASVMRLSAFGLMPLSMAGAGLAVWIPLLITL